MPAHPQHRNANHRCSTLTQDRARPPLNDDDGKGTLAHKGMARLQTCTVSLSSPFSPALALQQPQKCTQGKLQGLAQRSLQKVHLPLAPSWQTSALTHTLSTNQAVGFSAVAKGSLAKPETPQKAQLPAELPPSVQAFVHLPHAQCPMWGAPSSLF